MKTVKIYGPGCKPCEATEAMVKDAAVKMASTSRSRRSLTRRPLPGRGVMSTPGVSIDGKLVHTGGLPDANRLERWLSS